MKKKQILNFGLLVLSIVTLSSCSCSSIINFGSESSTPDYPSNTIPVELGKYAGQNITLKEVKAAGDTICLDPTGNQNILVIPITFKDYPLERLNLKEEDVKRNISDAFFGEALDTGWESVSSFYKKSSFGKLNLTGEVSDIVTLNYNLVDFVTQGQAEPTYYALEKSVQEFKKNYQGDITKFDQNHDGYLDAVWMVYLPPYLNSETEAWYLRNEPKFTSKEILNKASNVLWAYTYWDTTTESDKKSPNPNVYAWASYEFLKNNDYCSFFGGCKVDAHTFIHETGHVMGLDDYYSYDQGDAPCGGLDMMDNNVGDHNTYSKYMYGWVEPEIVKEPGTYHLRPAESTGDCLLVPTSLDSFNNSPFDEFLMLEYYTPTGLNLLDSKHAYESGVRNFYEPGVKIYHVDSRLGNLKYKHSMIGQSGMVFEGYTDKVISTKDSYTTIVANNTPRYSYTNDRLLTLLSDAHGAKSNYYYVDRPRNLANNKDLFQEGSLVNGFTFNDKQKMNYQITFENMNEEGIDIVFKSL